MLYISRGFLKSRARSHVTRVPRASSSSAISVLARGHAGGGRPGEGPNIQVDRRGPGPGAIIIHCYYYYYYYYYVLFIITTTIINIIITIIIITIGSWDLVQELDAAQSITSS